MYRTIHFLCVSLCVSACICFQWQWVHFILNAPVSLLSRTRSDQVLVVKWTKLKQHKTKQKCVFCLGLVQEARRCTGRWADWRGVSAAWIRCILEKSITSTTFHFYLGFHHVLGKEDLLRVVSGREKMTKPSAKKRGCGQQERRRALSLTRCSQSSELQYISK